MSTLVIVESPAKAKTIRKHLGKGFDVTASMGHIRDLPASRLGIDLENNYAPQYINIKGKGKLIKSLKDEAKKADRVLLAADPDREGEAISWHLAHILGLDTSDKNRVTFGEITKKGIDKGMENIRSINMDLFDAQQARRVLDRLVGYKLSPFLWKKVKRGLSAGRVQSVAVRLIVDREREIEAFVPQEYWNLDALLSVDKKASVKEKFAAHFFGTKNGEKIEVKTGEQAKTITDSLQDKEYSVLKLKKGTRKRSPAAPFITSTLQQEASRRFGFGASRTMRAAQTLYEGVDIPGMGMTGLITYMRTDSLRLSDEALDGAKAYILGKFGEKYTMDKPRVFKRKGKANAQDAHEAVRPTMPDFTPQDAEKVVGGDVAKLYRLIWSRFTASQMADCKMDTVSADIGAGDYLFRASGYIVTFDGFTALYEEATDEKTGKEEALPEMAEGMPLFLHELTSDQKFTQPPARYSEASLIKALEENGIGRPSTYAPIINTVVDRGYVEKEQKRLAPTVLGFIVSDLLAEQFSDIVDVRFSSAMEDKLDEVEAGDVNWVKVVDGFYKEFEKSLDNAEKALDGQKIKVPEEVTDVICEKCGKNMVVKSGRYGKFLACPGFPECSNTKPIIKEMAGKCSLCDGKMVLRKSKKGRVYYGCANYPACEFMTWDEPVEDICEKCGASLFKKGGKNAMLVCAKEGCGFTKLIEKKA